MKRYWRSFNPSQVGYKQSEILKDPRWCTGFNPSQVGYKHGHRARGVRL